MMMMILPKTYQACLKLTQLTQNLPELPNIFQIYPKLTILILTFQNTFSPRQQKVWKAKSPQLGDIAEMRKRPEKWL